MDVTGAQRESERVRERERERALRCHHPTLKQDRVALVWNFAAALPPTSLPAAILSCVNQNAISPAVVFLKVWQNCVVVRVVLLFEVMDAALVRAPLSTVHCPLSV